MQKEKGIVSIKVKLLGVIVPVVIVSILVLVLIAYRTSAGLIESYSENLLESSVENQASQIESWLEQNIGAFQIVKTTIENTKPDDKELQTMLDSYYNYNSNYPEGLYIADETGKLWKASDSAMSESDPVNSVWYQEGLTRVNMAIGSSYVNSEGVSVISASGILNDGSGKMKVISADMTLDRISVIVNAFIEMKNAEAILVDKDTATILASRDSAKISTTLGSDGSSAFEQSVAAKIADRDYSFSTLDGNMTVFEEVSGTNWILVSYIPTSTVLADLANLRNLMILISVISILILCVVIERTTHVVIAPVRKLTNVIKALTDGDFTVSVKSSGNDEIALMSRSVERFIASMKQMIASMGDISGKLGTQADASDSVSREMQSAANVQSQSMSELNMTVDQLSVSVNEIADNATKLAGVVADTKDDSVNVGNKMRETVEVSQKGREDMEHVGEALENIRTSIQNLEAAVNKVGTASGEIVEIVQLIGNIAEETNLLSLNASIEAARAGEAGRGFAVVAEQIRQLAEQSTQSAVDTRELIEASLKEIEEGNQAVERVSTSLEEVIDGIKQIAETSKRLSDNSKDQAEAMKQAEEGVNQISEVVQSNSATAQESSATSEELSAQAIALDELIGKFVLKN